MDQVAKLLRKTVTDDDGRDHQIQGKTENKDKISASKEVSTEQDFQDAFFEELKVGSFDNLGFPVNDQALTEDVDGDVFKSWDFPVNDQEQNKVIEGVSDSLGFPVNGPDSAKVTHNVLDKYGFPLYGNKEKPSTLYNANGKLHYSENLYLSEETIAL